VLVPAAFACDARNGTTTSKISALKPATTGGANEPPLPMINAAAAAANAASNISSSATVRTVCQSN